MEILLPRMKYTHEIVGKHGGALLLERAPGACSGSNIPRVYRPLGTLGKDDDSSENVAKRANLHSVQT